MSVKEDAQDDARDLHTSVDFHLMQTILDIVEHFIVCSGSDQPAILRQKMHHFDPRLLRSGSGLALATRDHYPHLLLGPWGHLAFPMTGALRLDLIGFHSAFRWVRQPHYNPIFDALGDELIVLEAFNGRELPDFSWPCHQSGNDRVYHEHNLASEGRQLLKLVAGQKTSIR